MNTKIQMLYFALFLFIPSLTAQESTDFSQHSYETLDSLTKVYYTYGDYDNAIAVAEQIMKKAKTESGEGDSIYLANLLNLGKFYTDLGEFEQSETYNLKGEALVMKYFGEGHPLFSNVANNLGTLYDYLGDLEKAKVYYLKAEALEKKYYGEATAAYALTLLNLAGVYQRMGLFKQAAPLFSKSISIERSVLGEKNPEHGYSLTSYADFFFVTGKYEEAELLYLKALKILTDALGENHVYLATTVNNLAALYREMGKIEATIPLLLQVINITKQNYGEKHQAYFTTLMNLATVYYEMEKYQDARELYQKVKPMMEEILGTKHPKYIRLISKLAKLYFKLEQKELYQELVLKAAKLGKEVLGETHSDYADVLVDQALMYRRDGQYSSAKNLYLNIEKIRRNSLGIIHPSYGNLLNLFSHLFIEMDSLDAAMVYCLAGIAINCKTPQNLPTSLFGGTTINEIDDILKLSCPSLVISDLNQLSSLSYNSRTNFKASLKTLLEITKLKYQKSIDQKTKKQILLSHYTISKIATEVNEKIRNDFVGKKDKLRVLRDNGDFVEMGLEAAIELNNARYYEEAFGFAEQNKSILLADALKENRARALGSLPDNLAEEETNLLEEKKAIGREFFEAKSEEEKESIIVRENKLNQEIDVFLNQIKKEYPQYHKLKYADITATAQNIQQELDDKTLFLEYVVRENKIYLFALTKNSIELIPISVVAEELITKVKNLRLALSDYKFIIKKELLAYQLFTESAHWFYTTILKAAIKDKSIENLIIVPDAILGYLPFEVFLVEEAPQKKSNYGQLHYLLNDYNISYNYSATLFVNSKQELKSNKKNGTGRLLACAASYPRISHSDSTIQEGIDSNLNQLRQPYAYHLRTILESLPAAENEVKALAEKFDGDFLQGKETNEAFFKKNAANYGIIHLAMHGILHAEMPMLSSLAFTENGDSLEDNFLQAYEISQLKLNAELVVLSACETGHGHFEQGEGIISLGRSFMYAGVPALVVSLWQVNDQSTASIMTSFYNNLSNGLPKNVALRAAKIEYLKNSNGLPSHPAFWSPFIMIGNTEAISISQKGIASIWLIGGGVVVLLGLVGFIIRRRRKEVG